MSQCVQNWDFDEESILSEISMLLSQSTLLDTPQEARSLKERVAELTWKRGKVAMHDLDACVLDKPIPLWDDTPRGDGTLESVVKQATCHSSVDVVNQATCHPSVDDMNKIVLWFDHEIPDMVYPGATTVPFDPLLPCHDNMLMHDHNQEPYTHVQGTGMSSTQLVSLAAAAYPPSLGISSNPVERDNMELTLLANTISGQDYTKTSVDHYDSISHSRSQRKEADGDGKTNIGKVKSSISTKKKRAAAIHNEAERKRRERINQKMKALQNIVPNSSKTDKASLLDTVIEFTKQLQGQVQMLCRMYLPLVMQQQQLHTSIMTLKKEIMDIDTNNINHAAALPPAVTPPPFIPALLDNSGNCLPMPPTIVEAMSAPPVILRDNSGNTLSTPPMGSVMLDPFATILASQPQPMTMDAYNSLVTMSQQMRHPPPSKN